MKTLIQRNRRVAWEAEVTSGARNTIHDSDVSITCNTRPHTLKQIEYIYILFPFFDFSACWPLHLHLTTQMKFFLAFRCSWKCLQPVALCHHDQLTLLSFSLFSHFVFSLLLFLVKLLFITMFSCPLELFFILLSCYFLFVLCFSLTHMSRLFIHAYVLF